MPKSIKSRSVKQKASIMLDTDTQGVGKYATGQYSSAVKGKQIKGLTRRQATKLEKLALQNEALKINARPQMIKAAGTAIAQNLSAPSATASVALVDKMTTKSQDNVSSLINGGAGLAQKDNDEESLQDQYQIR